MMPTHVIVPRIEVETHLAKPFEGTRAVYVRGDKTTRHSTLVDELVDLRTKGK